MEIFKFIQFFIFKIADLSDLYIKFLKIIFKKKYKNMLKATELNLKFFINLKIYSHLKGEKNENNKLL